MRTVDWKEGLVEMIDQTRLPEEVVVLHLTRVEEVAEAIATMRVRGAPAIGVAAAMGLVLAANAIEAASGEELAERLAAVGEDLKRVRPTAVNLAWAIQRMVTAARERRHLEVDALRAYLQLEAQVMAQEDVDLNQALGRNGIPLFPDHGDVLTLCSTGSLATVEYGTAVGTIRSARAAGKQIHVWVSETRPRLQGARLNAWELQNDQIPFTVITDSMAGHLMQQGRVDLVITGADRIAANGDSANKIGTYSLAVLAHHHRIPFYIAAPLSTFDPDMPTGALIPIEERSAEEVTHIAGKRVVVEGARVFNPAFDVTPASLIQGIVTERGVLRPPFDEAIARTFGRPAAV